MDIKIYTLSLLSILILEIIEILIEKKIFDITNYIFNIFNFVILF